MIVYPKDYKISCLIAKKMIGTILPAEEDAELKENGCVDLKKYQWNC